MISARTISLLIDAGLGGDTLKQITAAFETDIENVVSLLRSVTRNSVTPVTPNDVTPAALRMRKMRENKRCSAENGGEKGGVTGITPVTDCDVTSVTSYINLTSSKEVLKEESRKEQEDVGKRNRRNIGYTPAFENFWKAFPTDPGMSKSEAFKVWGKLPEADHEMALRGIPGFKLWASKQGKDYRTVHAVRYLSQRRFDGFDAVAQSPKVPRTLVAEDSLAWRAWTKARGKPPPALDIRTDAGVVRGYYFPTEYPPQEGQAA